MSCCLGISIEKQLNRQTYEQATSQIQDFIAQTSYKIIPHNNLLIISNGVQKYRIPNNPSYIFSHLQHFTVTENEDEDFIEVVIQCLMILKQHFPHKIEIEMLSDLPLIYNLKNKVQEEIPRRLISRIKALQSLKKQLTQQQVQILIYNLNSQTNKNYQQKLKSISIKLLAEAKINPKIWSNLQKNEIKVINEIASDPAYQKIGIEILQKIVRNNEYQNLQNLLQKQNVECNAFQYQNQQQQKPQFDGPLDTMTALFQLRQSINIQRLSWIINSIDCTRLETKKIKKFDLKIRQTAQKFISGVYSNYTISQAKSFGRALSEYEMKRENLGWKELIQNVLIKIEDEAKNKGKYLEKERKQC